MLNEPTCQKLLTMKLFGLAAAFQEYLDHSVSGQDKMTFDQRFGLMVDREWNERQQRRLTRRLAMAKLREQACVEDIDYRHPRNLDRSVLQRLATCQWIRNRENVILHGPTGIGKTWLACALANQACRQGFSALYLRLPRLLHHLHIARGDGSYGKELNRLARTDVLLLDDWALVPLGDRDRRDLLEILEDRYDRHSTIVTSQIPVDRWHEHIGDPTLADSILDRLVHNAHRISLKGPSKRKGAVKNS